MHEIQPGKQCSAATPSPSPPRVAARSHDAQSLLSPFVSASRNTFWISDVTEDAQLTLLGRLMFTLRTNSSRPWLAVDARLRGTNHGIRESDWLAPSHTRSASSRVIDGYDPPSQHQARSSGSIKGVSRRLCTCYHSIENFSQPAGGRAVSGRTRGRRDGIWTLPPDETSSPRFPCYVAVAEGKSPATSISD